MPENNPHLLRALGNLARGLSALFWGLPSSLVICAETARAEWLKPLQFFPALAVNGLILYGLWQMTAFQKQERPWRAALDRAMLLALVILGLCPFIYWHNLMPEQAFFARVVMALTFAAVLFLFCLNLVILQLGAMLPDETLRQETRQFTALNRWLLVVLVFFGCLYLAFAHIAHPTLTEGRVIAILNHISSLLLIFLVLLPLAMTMALIWKTKEVILDAVFGARN